MDPKSDMAFLADYLDVALVLELEFTTHVAPTGNRFLVASLESIPGVGIIGATAIATTITDPSAFKSGRDLAAWIGLVPRQNSTGGKDRLGGISKQGDRYLRRLLVVGATAVVRQARLHPRKYPWVAKLLVKKPAKVVAIAVANKTGRIAWRRTNRADT